MELLRMFTFKTVPFTHQKDTLTETWERAGFAILWEQGTGKTKLMIDNAAALYRAGKITAMLVVAPNGVHLNWVRDEMQAHWPDDLPWCAHAYDTKRAKTKKHAAELAELNAFSGFKLLAVSYDSMITPRAKPIVKDYLKNNKCIYVADEIQYIKTPKSKRHKTVLASSVYAPYRRALSGTPITNTPFDMYAVMKFLSRDFWKPHGVATFAAFQAYFGVAQPAYYGSSFTKYVGFRRLEEMKSIVRAHSSRVLKADVLDLPPKLYSKRYVEMSPEQTRLYNQIRDEYRTAMASGEEISAPLAIVRMLRLQQILCGFVKDDEGNEHDIDGDNPRLESLQEICASLDHKAIIWVRFTRNVNQIMQLLPNAVRYDGQVKTKARLEALDDFQRGDAQFFVAKASSAGRGLTLTAAQTVIYHSNTFKLEERQQSEDRAHRIGQEHPVHYIDQTTPGTMDQRIVDALINKRDVASQVTGDNLGEWI